MRLLLAQKNGRKHPHYDTTVNLANKLAVIVTGEGQGELLKKFFPNETEEEQEQREGMTNPITPTIIHCLDQPFKRIDRVDLAIDNIVSEKEKDIQKILSNWNREGEQLKKWIPSYLRFYNKIDPNSVFILSSYSGEQGKNDFYTSVAMSHEIIDKQQRGKEIVWITIKYNSYMEDYFLVKQPKYVLYCNEYATTLERLAEDKEGNQSSGDSPVIPFNPDAEFLSGNTYIVDFSDSSKKGKKKDLWRLRVDSHGIGYCPVRSVGYIPCEITRGQTYINYFDKVLNPLLDLVEEWSEKWVVKRLHTRAGMFIIIPPYKGDLLSKEDKEAGLCLKLKDTECKRMCNTCHQKRYVSMYQIGSQEAIIYELPSGEEDWGELKADNLHSYRKIPEKSVEYSNESVEYLTKFIFKAIYGREDFTKSETLATGARIKEQFKMDVIFDYVKHIITHIKFWTDSVSKANKWTSTRVCSYPDDLEPQTLSYLLELSGMAQKSGVPQEAISQINAKLYNRLFEDSPEKRALFDVWRTHVVLLNKSEKERQTLLGLGAIDGVTITNYEKFVYTHLPVIQYLVSIKHLDFVDMPFDKQAEIIKETAISIRKLVTTKEFDAVTSEEITEIGG